jgi:predicted transcriptional regulator
MASRSISASVSEATATKLRVLASREDRTVSSLISNAISLYTDLPQELRLAWKQMQASDERSFQAFLREVTALTVQKRFERARQELAASIPRSPELAEMPESDLADAAVEMEMKR